MTDTIIINSSKIELKKIKATKAKAMKPLCQKEKPTAQIDHLHQLKLVKKSIIKRMFQLENKIMVLPLLTI